MTKNFCDICGKEFKKDELFGGVMRLQRQNLLQGAQPQAQIQKQALDTCEECTAIIWQTIQKIKDEKCPNR